MTKLKQENLAQAEAFRRMHGNILDLIWKYGAEFRDIITAFEEQHNRAPTADDLLYIASQHAGYDITQGES